MGTTSKRGYYYPDGNDEVSLFPDQHRVLAMTKIDTDMNTALTETSALESRIAELEQKTRTTGRRDISSLMENADGGTVRVNRVGNLVELSIYGVVPSGEVSTSTTRVFGSSGFPAGFRPMSSMVFPLSTVAPLDPGMLTRTYSDGYGRMDMNNPGAPLYGNVTFVTGDAWPSPLPGDPA